MNCLFITIEITLIGYLEMVNRIFHVEFAESLVALIVNFGLT